MRGDAAHHEQILALAANDRRARKRFDPHWVQKITSQAPEGLTAMEKALWSIERVTPHTIIAKEAHHVRELAITYSRDKHLPMLAATLDWPIGVSDRSEIIARLGEVLRADALVRRAAKPPVLSIPIRRLARRAYIAERLQRLRSTMASRRQG